VLDVDIYGLVLVDDLDVVVDAKYPEDEVESGRQKTHQHQLPSC